MFECILLGDSIALATAEYLRTCVTVARIGASAAEVSHWPVEMAGDAVISVGSNDPTSPTLEASVRALRARIQGHVVWILPACCKGAAGVIERVAREHKDRLVRFTPGADGVHPRAPRTLANAARSALKEAP